MNATTIKPLAATSKSGRYRIIVNAPFFSGSVWRIYAYRADDPHKSQDYSGTFHCELAARAAANALWRTL